MVYKGVSLDCGDRLDLVVEEEVVVEVKSVQELAKVHEAQLLSYLRLRGGGRGLLINFSVCSVVNCTTSRVRSDPKSNKVSWQRA